MFDAAAAYLDEARRSFRGYKRMAEGAMAQLTDDEFFRLIDPEGNSVAIIVKHLTGNMRSRFTDFLTSDGEKPNPIATPNSKSSPVPRAPRSYPGGKQAGKSFSAPSNR